MAHLHRHLAALWFADIVGYTRLSEQDEGGAVRVAQSFHRATREVVERFGGRVVKLLGDGAMAEFSSSEAAVRSAHALHAAVARAAGRDGVESPALRIAVHVGDVAATGDGDLYGDGVNVASRLQAVAEPGEVWVSDDVWRQLRRRPELRFESRGALELKGLGQPLEAHAVTVLDEEEWGEAIAPLAEESVSSSTFLHRRRGLLLGAAVLAILAIVAVFLVRDRSALVPEDAIAESAAPGVAVVPFSVNDPELERWREGMVDLLSTNLDGAAGLRAIDSRTVLARWREIVPEEGVADLPTALEVARRSGGKYGLVGSVVSSGTSIRLSAELYDLEDGDVLGRPQVEGSPDSIFGLVDRLSIQILGLILEEEGGNAPAVDLAAVTTSSLPALKSFLEGEGLARRGDFGQAIPAYRSALEADSTFALAHVRLGDALGWRGGLEQPDVRRAYAAAERFADRLPQREADLLEVSLAYANARQNATELARQAAQRYPDDPGAWYLLGEVYFHLPQQALATRDEAREAFQRAFRLDPSFLPAEIHLIDLAFYRANRAAVDSLMRRFDPATAGSEYGEAYGLAYTLAFGDSVSRAGAYADIRTVEISMLPHITSLLNHPRFADTLLRVLRIARARPEFAGAPPQVDLLYALTLMEAGELDALVEAVDTGEIREPAASQAMSIAWFSELPIPEQVYDRALFPDPADSLPGVRQVVAAFRALERGDRATARRTSESLRAAAADLLAGGDSTTAREAAAAGFAATGDSLIAQELEWIARAIDARAKMLAGNREEGVLAEFDAIYRGGGFQPAAVWAAEILEERGEIERAIRYVEQLGISPTTGMWLGTLYEKLGRRAEATEAYGWVLLGWEGADPDLEPHVALARQAIARLEGLQRG